MIVIIVKQWGRRQINTSYPIDTSSIVENNPRHASVEFTTFFFNILGIINGITLLYVIQGNL